jgi:hypothetical protein
VRPGGTEAMPCFKISRIGLMSSVAGRIKDHLHVTGNAWPGVPKQQHQCVPLQVFAANIDPQDRLRGIRGGLLLLFGLLSRCLSGSCHIDQREAAHHQRQDGYGSTEGHPIFRPDVL